NAAVVVRARPSNGHFEIAVSPPHHIHRREDETFYVQQGTLTIHVGDRILLASPGERGYLPRGIMHVFKNTGNVDANFLVVVTSAGFENFFAEAVQPAVDRSAVPAQFDR